MSAITRPPRARLGRFDSPRRLASRVGAPTWRQVRALGLVARFTIIGASVALLVASALAWLIEDWPTEIVHEQIAVRAVDQTRMGVADHVSAADFEPPHVPEKLADLRRRLDPHLAPLVDGRSGTIRLHLIARDGTIVYSDVASKQGYTIDVATAPVLEDDLAGSVGKKISTLSSRKTTDWAATSSPS